MSDSFYCFNTILIIYNFTRIGLYAFSIYISFDETIYLLATIIFGITFNYGIILGWTSINSNELNILPFIFYIGAIFWTLGYDTVYGFQDIKDDEIIGLKSTSIKFKSNPYLFLKICYSIFLVNLILIGIL